MTKEQIDKYLGKNVQIVDIDNFKTPVGILYKIIDHKIDLENEIIHSTKNGYYLECPSTIYNYEFCKSHIKKIIEVLND